MDELIEDCDCEECKCFRDRRELSAEIASLKTRLELAERVAMRFAPDYSEIEGTSVFIQWKGTDVCLDFSCECGAGGHFDGDFAYQLRCGACKKVFDLPHTISLVPQRRFEHEIIKDVEMDDREAYPDQTNQLKESET